MVCAVLKNRGIILLTLAIALLAFSCAGGPDSAEMDESAIEAAITARMIHGAASSSAIYEIKNIHEAAAIYAITNIYAASAIYGVAADDAGEEIVIPVVEPKKMEPRKAYVEPTVRVQLLGGASSITIESTEGLSLSFGANIMKVQAGSRIRFKPRSARVSVRSYTVGVATFKADGYEEAVEFAEEWKRQKYTVRLIKAGGPLVQADGTVSDTTIYWVALGIFKNERSAERFRDKMFARGISCWVIDESVLDPRGNIEL